MKMIGEDFGKDVLSFCLKKKFERDQKIYKKPRLIYFDDFRLSKILNIFKKKY